MRADAGRIARARRIARAERRFGVRFPEDYRHYLATEGSMARFLPPADDFW